MATYSLSGSGIHALTASTTGLQVTITTPSSIGGVGRSNPIAKYDQGLIRFSDGTSYWSPVAILGGPQFVPVPGNATSFGYALLGGAVISVVEVIDGTLFFSSGTQSVETLSDVQITSIADGQVLEWVASAGKWENVTPSTGGGAIGHASTVLGADVSLSTTNTFFDVVSLSLAAGTWVIVARMQAYNAPLNSPHSFEFQIISGATVHGGGSFSEVNNSFISDASGLCVAVLGGAATVTLQMRDTSDNRSVVRFAMPNGAAGATLMVALQVA